MRILTQVEGLALLDRMTIPVDQVEQDLPGMDAAAGKPGWLKYALQEGMMECSELALNGETVGAIYFHVQKTREEKVLHINAAISIVKFDIAPVLETAFRVLAKKLDCPIVEYVTQRPGMVRKSAAYGYRIFGVVLRKRMNP